MAKNKKIAQESDVIMEAMKEVAGLKIEATLTVENGAAAWHLNFDDQEVNGFALTSLASTIIRDAQNFTGTDLDEVLWWVIEPLRLLDQKKAQEEADGRE